MNKFVDSFTKEGEYNQMKRMMLAKALETQPARTFQGIPAPVSPLTSLINGFNKTFDPKAFFNSQPNDQQNTQQNTQTNGQTKPVDFTQQTKNKALEAIYGSPQGNTTNYGSTNSARG